MLERAKRSVAAMEGSASKEEAMRLEERMRKRSEMGVLLCLWASIREMMKMLVERTR